MKYCDLHKCLVGVKGLQMPGFYFCGCRLSIVRERERKERRKENRRKERKRDEGRKKKEKIKEKASKQCALLNDKGNGVEN